MSMKDFLFRSTTLFSQVISYLFTVNRYFRIVELEFGNFIDIFSISRINFSVQVNYFNW